MNTPEHAPPRNGKGALPAPVPNPFNSPQSNSGVAVAQACTHKNTVAVREPPGKTHFSKEVCIVCGAFLRWLPRPETLERQRLNAFRLARLAMCNQLSTWERGFVGDVLQCRKLSPQQQEVVAELNAKYLEAKAQ